MVFSLNFLSCNPHTTIGIGWTTTVIVFYLNCYYNVILTWSFYYLFASFNTELPWDSCDNYWNTDACSLFDDENVEDDVTFNTSTIVTDDVTVEYSGIRIDSTTEFWE